MTIKIPTLVAKCATRMGHPRVNVNIKIVKGNGQECPFHTCMAALCAADSRGRLSPHEFST
jgi:hypothetical protein